jgi:hypothetical protein
MRMLILLLGMVACSAASGQTGVVQQATGEYFKSCQAKFRNSNPDVRVEREAIEVCTVDAAVAANVLPGALVEACRDEMKSSQTTFERATSVRACVSVRHFGAKMDDREWRLAVENYCSMGARLPGGRYQARKNECLTEILLEQRQVSTTRRQACTKPSTGNPTVDAEERWRCLSAPGNP